MLFTYICIVFYYYFAPTCFGAVTIFRELTPMLLKRTAMKWFTIIIYINLLIYTPKEARYNVWGQD
jgi:hypothetical protein